MRPFEQTGPYSAMYDNRSIWSIGGHVSVVLGYHQWKKNMDLFDQWDILIAGSRGGPP